MDTVVDADVSAQLEPLTNLLKNRRVLALSGAGISTESGIPDYRSPEQLAKPRNPTRYHQFVGSAAARQRYWARSFRGWTRVAEAQPNRGHEALAQLEANGTLSGLITQNVDGLHQVAGSQHVLELHGGLDRVRCLECGALEPRPRLQRRMLHLNPDFGAHILSPAPDGDADLPEMLIDGFVVPSCLRCRGVLKPDVVFFGENVPKTWVERAWQMLEEAEVLLVVGSSLTVFSGYRFVARAAREGKPVAILNRGPTRGDAEATLKLEGALGELLPALSEKLEASRLKT